MKKHTLVKQWKEGRATSNGWLTIPEGSTAEVMAHQGFDSLTIDMQHGIHDYLKVVDLLRAINTTPTKSIVRVPWLDPTHIMKILDVGASGIICPMINNKEEAEKLVEYAYYPPLGKRSFGPIRAKFLYEEDYDKCANDEILVFAMIETKEALDNLEDILSVEGVDAVFIGPADLSFSLGYKPKFDQEEPFVLNIIKHILSTAKKYDKFAGIYNGTVDYAKKMVQLGFDFVTIGSDVNFLTKEASRVCRDFKNLSS